MTAVICLLSFKPTSSTLVVPSSVIVQLVAGTNLIPDLGLALVGFSPFPLLLSAHPKILSSFLQNRSQNIWSLLLFPFSGHNSFDSVTNMPNACSISNSLNFVLLGCSLVGYASTRFMDPPYISLNHSIKFLTQKNCFLHGRASNT